MDRPIRLVLDAVARVVRDEVQLGSALKPLYQNPAFRDLAREYIAERNQTPASNDGNWQVELADRPFAANLPTGVLIVMQAFAGAAVLTTSVAALLGQIRPELMHATATTMTSIVALELALFGSWGGAPWLSNRFPVLAMGTGFYVARLQAPRSGEVDWTKEFGNSESVPQASEPERRKSLSGGAPAVPGLTEAALSQANDPFGAMRLHLSRVRLLDLTLAIGFVATVLVVAFAVAFQAVQGKADSMRILVTGLAGGGPVAVLAYMAISRLRQSQVALAIYETFVIQMEQTLARAGLPDGPDQATIDRAWVNLRRGLNELAKSDRPSPKF